MTISDIKQFLTNKITALEGQKAVHFTNGDMENYERVDLELTETKESLAKLENLQ